MHETDLHLITPTSIGSTILLEVYLAQQDLQGRLPTHLPALA